VQAFSTWIQSQEEELSHVVSDFIESDSDSLTDRLVTLKVSCAFIAVLLTLFTILLLSNSILAVYISLRSKVKDAYD
jgi:hypothetical protein